LERFVCGWDNRTLLVKGDLPAKLLAPGPPQAQREAARREANHQDQAEQRLKLNKYCDENDVTPTLRHKVLRNFLWTYQNVKQRVHEEDIEFFKDLQAELKFKMHLEVYAPILRTHPIFEFLEKKHVHVVRAVAHLAMTAHRFLAGDAVFFQGHKAHFMYHILAGSCEYSAGNGSGGSTNLVAGSWACEPALFVRWRLKGQLVAKSSSELVLIDVRRLDFIVADAENRGEDLELIRQVAVEAALRFKSTAPDTDLWGDMEALRRICERADEDQANPSTRSQQLFKRLRSTTKERLQH